MATFFNEDLLDRYIAPNASAFKVAQIAAVADDFDQHDYWVANFFLNTVLRSAYMSEAMPYVTAFLRKAEGAFYYYDLGREATARLLRGSQTNPSLYARALMQWEGFVAQATTAHAVLMSLIQQSDPTFRLFSPGDGSIEQRLRHMNNSMKHVDSRITSGQLLPDAVSPVWMSEQGLHVTDSLVTWVETEAVVREIGDWADKLQDSTALRENLQGAADHS